MNDDALKAQIEETYRLRKINMEARRYFSEQSDYWRKQGDLDYAEKCEQDLAKFQD